MKVVALRPPSHTKLTEPAEGAAGPLPWPCSHQAWKSAVHWKGKTKSLYGSAFLLQDCKPCHNLGLTLYIFSTLTASENGSSWAFLSLLGSLFVGNLCNLRSDTWPSGLEVSPIATV